MAEDYGNQKYYEHVVIRPYDAWWRDFLFLAQEVEKGGSRAWIWSGFEFRVAGCRVSPKPSAGHLLGLRRRPWMATLERHRQRHIKAIEQVARAMQAERS